MSIQKRWICNIKNLVTFMNYEVFMPVILKSKKMQNVKMRINIVLPFHF